MSATTPKVRVAKKILSKLTIDRWLTRQKGHTVIHVSSFSIFGIKVTKGVGGRVNTGKTLNF